MLEVSFGQNLTVAFLGVGTIPRRLPVPFQDSSFTFEAIQIKMKPIYLVRHHCWIIAL
jgi:hypothetical protein